VCVWVCVCVVFFSRKNLLSVAVSAKSFHPSPRTKPEPPERAELRVRGYMCVPYNHKIGRFIYLDYGRVWTRVYYMYTCIRSTSLARCRVYVYNIGYAFVYCVSHPLVRILRALSPPTEKIANSFPLLLMRWITTHNYLYVYIHIIYIRYAPLRPNFIYYIYICESTSSTSHNIVLWKKRNVRVGSSRFIIKRAFMLYPVHRRRFAVLMSFYRLFGSFFSTFIKGQGSETETLRETKRDTKLGRKLYHEKN